MTNYQSQPTETPPHVVEFMKSVRGRNYDAVRASAQSDPSLLHAFDYQSFGAPAIVHAVNNRDRKMVDLLLEMGADIHQRSAWWAGSYGVLPNDDADMTQFLIDRGARVDIGTAVQMNDFDKVRSMLDADPDQIRVRGGDGCLPLHFARSTEMVDLLIERGADIDGRCIDHESTAAEYLCTNSPAAARRLIDRYGVKPDPFMCVAIGDTTRLAAMLDAEPELLKARLTGDRLATSENTNAMHIYAYVPGHDSTLMHVAASCGQRETIKFLIQRGCDVDIHGAYDESTALHNCAWNGNLDMAEFLLECGADINRKSGKIHENEPIGWAIVAGRPEMVSFLLDRGAAIHEYHLKYARDGAQSGCNFTNAPIGNFLKIVALLASRSDD